MTVFVDRRAMGDGAPQQANVLEPISQLAFQGPEFAAVLRFALHPRRAARASRGAIAIAGGAYLRRSVSARLAPRNRAANWRGCCPANCRASRRCCASLYGDACRAGSGVATGWVLGEPPAPVPGPLWRDRPDRLSGAGFSESRRHPIRCGGRQPVPVSLVAPLNHVEVDVLHLARYGSDIAVADRSAVEVGNGRDLGAGSAQEQLVTAVEFGPVNRPFDRVQAEFPGGQLDDGCAGYSLEDVFGYSRRDQVAVANDEQVFAGSPR